jgi:hypothetical protein
MTLSDRLREQAEARLALTEESLAYYKALIPKNKGNTTEPAWQAVELLICFFCSRVIRIDKDEKAYRYDSAIHERVYEDNLREYVKLKRLKVNSDLEPPIAPLLQASKGKTPKRHQKKHKDRDIEQIRAIVCSQCYHARYGTGYRASSSSKE